MVNTFYRAYHAGVSKDYFGRENVNNFSVGIEIVNVGNGSDPYPDAQVLAVRLLCGYLSRHHFRGQIKQIVSHEYIATPYGRKNDPINYPWESLFDLSDELKVALIYGRPDKEVVVRNAPPR
jgi:N-acetylmuramoyl-L-alanine amidase/AmpD protein